MRGLLHDTRYAVRVLLNAPGYLAACLVTLALGIGTTTVIFAVVDGALWRPLPYHDADRIVRFLWRLPPGVPPARVTSEAPLTAQRRESVTRPGPNRSVRNPRTTGT